MKNLLIGTLIFISTNVFAAKPSDCDKALYSNDILCNYLSYKKEIMVLEVLLQKDTTYRVIGDTVHLQNASMGIKLDRLEESVQLIQFGDSVLISKLEPNLSLKKVEEELGKLVIVYSNK